jgi:hypothetical protein
MNPPTEPKHFFSEQQSDANQGYHEQGRVPQRRRLAVFLIRLTFTHIDAHG